MHRIFISIIVLMVLLSGSSVFASDYGDIPNCKIVRVHDGDTIIVNIPNEHPLFGSNISVRIAHIDAPEIHGNCAREMAGAEAARLYMSRRLPISKVVVLHHVRRDKYFRILADIDIDGHDLANELINAGLVRAYEGDEKGSWCN